MNFVIKGRLRVDLVEIMKNRIIIIVNTSWNLVNFRSGLIKAMVSSGLDVVAIAPHDQYVAQVLALGCRYLPVVIDNKGTHIGRDLILVCRFFRLLVQERPRAILCYTVKPNIYASIVAHALRIPVINNIAGLGTAFIRKGWLNTLVEVLYRIALSRSAKVFFQNDDDLKLFLSKGLAPTGVTDRLPGSGIDLDAFRPRPFPARPIVRFLLIARMLWDKGIGEFVEAARILQQRGVEADFCLLGFLDVQNPAAISREQMGFWIKEGVVRYLGVSDNVRDEIAEADCVVLPSFYPEGTPRCLLEAAAMARPIVTTDSAGCRDVVEDGVSGYLCKPRDATDLADKLGRIVSLLPSEREAMGLQGRAKAEKEFDERIVIKKYLEAIRSILEKKSRSSADGISAQRE